MITIKKPGSNSVLRLVRERDRLLVEATLEGSLPTRLAASVGVCLSRVEVLQLRDALEVWLKDTRDAEGVKP